MCDLSPPSPRTYLHLCASFPCIRRLIRAGHWLTCARSIRLFGSRPFVSPVLLGFVCQLLSCHKPPPLVLSSSARGRWFLCTSLRWLCCRRHTDRCACRAASPALDSCSPRARRYHQPSTWNPFVTHPSLCRGLPLSPSPIPCSRNTRNIPPPPL